MATAPRVRCSATERAPLRVSLAGGGTDVPPLVAGLGGRVVSIALDLHVRATVEPFDEGWVRLSSSAAPSDPLVRRTSDAPSTAHALRLLEAALAAAGVTGGVSLSVDADVGPGSGLGGSGAVAVACLAALSGATGQDRPAPLALAAAALALERDRLGLTCGAQDPVVAALGGVVELTVRDDGSFDACCLDVPAALLAALERRVLLVDTELRRVSGDVFGRSGPLTEAEARELVLAAGDAAQALVRGDLGALTDAMRRSAAAKGRALARRGDPSEALIRALEQAGAEVARVCGAGEGGFVFVWAPTNRHSSLLRALGVDAAAGSGTLLQPGLAPPR